MLAVSKMIESENIESSLKETEIENFAFDESDVRTILKLYAPEFLDEQFGKVLFHQQFEELEEEIRSLINLERFTLLIEIECKHWISLHVETSRSGRNCVSHKSFLPVETDDADLFAYYYDPQNIGFHHKIKSVLLKFGKVIFPEREEKTNFDVTQSFILSLHFSLDYKNEKLDDNFSSSHKQPFTFQEFKILITSMLKEFKKVKNKIKTCSGIVSSVVQDSIRIMPDYKCANRLVLFLDCIALQDHALANQELKEYLIKEIIGEQNINKIRELRGMLFHRPEPLIIYPQDFKSAFVKPTPETFHSLSSYLKCVESALEGKVTDYTFLEEGTNHLTVPCKFGTNICKEEVKKLLLEFAEDFMKNFSDNLSKHPDKIMFDLTVNFVPLLETQDKKCKSPFAEIIKFRNQVVHNGFILYNTCPSLPNISLQNIFPEFKDFFLKFILCDQLSSVLKAFSENGKSENLKSDLEACFKTFLDQFLKTDDILKDDHLNIQGLIGEKPSKKNQFTLIAQIYLSTISWIDYKNNISIDKDVKTQHFSLPDDYSLLSDEQRINILRIMILIKQLHNSLNSSNPKSKGNRITQVGFDVLVEDFKNYLLTTSCLEESDFRLMYDSLINSGDDQNKELASIIAGYVSKIENLLREDRSNASKVIEDFKSFANTEGKIYLSKNIHKFRSMKGLGEIYDIVISDETVNQSPKTVIQNLLPLLFLSSGKAMTWISCIEGALTDDMCLELLSNETMEKEKLVKHLDDVPALFPLGVRWLLDKKLKFSERENLDFMKSCIEPLLQPNKTKHLDALLTFDTKYKDEFCNECLKLVIAKLPDLNFVALKPLFENENFARNVFKKLGNIGASENEKVNHEVELLMNFANFKYFKAIKFCSQKQYESALDCASGKKGYSKILQVLVDNGHVSPDSENIFQMKFLIANIQNKLGFALRNKLDSDFKKHVDVSMNILSPLQEKNENDLFRNLKISNLIAFNLHLQDNHEPSYNMYVAIRNKIFTLNPKSPRRMSGVENKEKINLNSDSLKKLFKLKLYRQLLKKGGRNLSLFTIHYRIAGELLCMAEASKTKDEKKNLLIIAFEEYSTLFFLMKDIYNLNNVLVKRSLSLSLLIANKLFVEFETTTIPLKNLKAYQILRDDGKILKGSWEIKFLIKRLESKFEIQLPTSIL